MVGVIATAEIDVDAAPGRVWSALTDSELVKRYMMGSEVVTDWRPGSPIVWKGEYNGKSFEDKGMVIEADPDHRLVITHFSPMTGEPDRPENYHTIVYELEPHGDSTHVRLDQDNNSSAEEAEHSRQNWAMMLESLKQTVEQG
jgi:uncharacterized protein YndB with AHSA1/START domain